MAFPTEELMAFHNLFWQYPVVTEKTFYEQNKEKGNFIGFPWATLIDKRIKMQNVFEILKNHIDTNKTYYTCCQHIYFKALIPLFRALNIRLLYSSHKTKDEHFLSGIELRPCPLYAANIEDEARNTLFKNSDFMKKKRVYLYSFRGAYNPKNYISGVRKHIFEMKHPEGCYIENTKSWFYESVVYNNQQNKEGKLNKDRDYDKNTERYNEILLESRFSLCPSGSGPNSIRLWESLGCGAIPVLLSDTLHLPPHPLWDKSIIKMNEKDLENLPSLLDKITEEEEMDMRRNCLEIYKHFRNISYTVIERETTPLPLPLSVPGKKYTDIIHYCCGKYPNVGGVARFDLQISLIFPDRAFFMGPYEKNAMLSYLKTCVNPVIITDNHLSCDIPNKYDVVLVHHGCARRTLEKNPDWGEPWKSLCTQGQDKMLEYRDPKTTKIVSISQSCTDDFKLYYDKKYTKFRIEKILHPSELNEDCVKSVFNSKPSILGNWIGIKKGERLIPGLKKTLQEYEFNQLNVKPLQNESYKDFNKRKQEIYLKSDIFLQISNSEGNSYATLDALICGLVIVASDVGLFYKDVPDNCFVKLDWRKNGDINYVKERLEYAWENRETLSRNARQWYMENCRFVEWEKKFNRLIFEN